ncbi:hypothetical protein PRIPAC_87083 [Pristionchus pacificus]|uniref:EGF domain-containing protein n=1 Tax=Pristionchus pacificus TaxID=54126 RepID=A0A2A6BT74_PRIPA|nr:hypothetical protein PRIPAC_87083 [Pristionchus pacificus]|eukprot:PDM69057.1 EGF domain-containing protein [Pristionchus pacificus]
MNIIHSLEFEIRVSVSSFHTLSHRSERRESVRNEETAARIPFNSHPSWLSPHRSSRLVRNTGRRLSISHTLSPLRPMRECGGIANQSELSFNCDVGAEAAASLLRPYISCSLLDNYGCYVGYCAKDNKLPDCTCTQCTCYDKCLTGPMCKTVLNTTDCNNCLKSPCPNTQNYTCTNGYNTRTCDCAAGKTGSNCEFKIGDPCASYPCMNGARCTSNGATFTCSCTTGRFGPQCQFSGDPCSDVACAATGNCTTIFDEARAICKCQDGYQGAKCDQLILQRTQLGTAACFLAETDLDSSSLFERHSDDRMTLDKCYEYMMANPKYQVYVVAGNVCYVGETAILKTSANAPNDCDNDCAGNSRQKCGTTDHAWQFTYSYTNETAQCDVTPKPCNQAKNQGHCVEQNNGFSCVCAPGWTGSDCNTANDPCSSLYCKNDGKCVPTADKSDAYCLCTRGYSASDCSVKDQCFFAPCENGGTCSSTIYGYTCQCDSSFAGRNCEIYLACSSSPCKNGTCTNGAQSGEYTCACYAGWTGRDCDEDINECMLPQANNQSLCQNTGTCVNTAGSYWCDCVNGTYGEDCSIILPTTAYNCLKYPCPNTQNYTCTNGYNTRTCDCIAGKTGNNCDFNIGDPCAEVPCLYGGYCASNGAAFTCQCKTDRFGPQCQCEHQSIPNPIPNSFSVSGDPCSDVTCAATGTCNTIFEVRLDCLTKQYCSSISSGLGCSQKESRGCYFFSLIA